MQKLADISFFESLCSGNCSSLGVFNYSGNPVLSSGTDIAPEDDITRTKDEARAYFQDRLNDLSRINPSIRPTGVYALKREDEEGRQTPFLVVGRKGRGYYGVLAEDFNEEDPPVYFVKTKTSEPELVSGSFENFIEGLRRGGKKRHLLDDKTADRKSFYDFPLSGQTSRLVTKKILSLAGGLGGSLGGLWLLGHAPGLLGVAAPFWMKIPFVSKGIAGAVGGNLGIGIGSSLPDAFATSVGFMRLMRKLRKIESQIDDGTASDVAVRKYHDCLSVLSDMKNGVLSRKAGMRTALRIMGDDEIYDVDYQDVDSLRQLKREELPISAELVPAV